MKFIGKVEFQEYTKDYFLQLYDKFHHMVFNLQLMNT